MRVAELIENLSQLDQDAYVNCYGGYDPEHGEFWDGLTEVVQESHAWDVDNSCPIYVVFLK